MTSHSYRRKWQAFGKQAAVAKNEMEASYFRFQQKEVHQLMMEAKLKEERKHFSENKRTILMGKLEAIQAKENEFWSRFRNSPGLAQKLTGPLAFRREQIEYELNKMGVTWNEVVIPFSRADDDDDNESDSDSDEEEKESNNWESLGTTTGDWADN
jgi:hypothetical protein